MLPQAGISRNMGGMGARYMKYTSSWTSSWTKSWSSRSLLLESRSQLRFHSTYEFLEAFRAFELMQPNNSLNAHSRLHRLVPRCLVNSGDLSRAALTTKVGVMACGGSQQKTSSNQSTYTQAVFFVPRAPPRTPLDTTAPGDLQSKDMVGSDIRLVDHLRGYMHLKQEEHYKLTYVSGTTLPALLKETDRPKLLYHPADQGFTKPHALRPLPLQNVCTNSRFLRSASIRSLIHPTLSKWVEL